MIVEKFVRIVVNSTTEAHYEPPTLQSWDQHWLHDLCSLETFKLLDQKLFNLKLSNLKLSNLNLSNLKLLLEVVWLKVV
jgi:hypothetical protein